MDDYVHAWASNVSVADLQALVARFTTSSPDGTVIMRIFGSQSVIEVRGACRPNWKMTKFDTKNV